MRGASAVFSAKSVHHCTPERILEPLRQLEALYTPGGQVGLDPCSNGRSIVGARVEWRRGGLRRSWIGYGLVYCNPPYGRGIGEWTRRCVETASLGERVAALLPVRTDCPWWQEDVRRARAICFPSGRLRFIGARSGAPFPSAVIFWGDAAWGMQARIAFRDVGWTVGVL